MTWGEQLHAPLVMRVPGVARRRISQPLSASDIFPTPLARVALPDAERWLAQASGHDILDRSHPIRPVLSQSSLRQHGKDVDEVYSLTGDRWKYFRFADGKEALYDLDADPHELNPLQAQHPRRVANMRQILERLLKEQRELGYFGD